MINGAHVIIYRKDAEADRAFFKDVLGFISCRCKACHGRKAVMGAVNLRKERFAN
jgi:uncharacterized membrane protein